MTHAPRDANTAVPSLGLVAQDDEQSTDFAARRPEPKLAQAFALPPTDRAYADIDRSVVEARPRGAGDAVDRAWLARGLLGASAAPRRRHEFDAVTRSLVRVRRLEEHLQA